MKTGKFISAKYLQKLVIFAGVLVFACVFDHYYNKSEPDKNPEEQQKNEEPKEEHSFICYFSVPFNFSLKITAQKDISKNLPSHSMLLKLSTHNNARTYHTLKTEMLNFSPDILQRNLWAINYYYTSPSDDIPLFS